MPRRAARRVLALCAAALVAGGLTACGGGDDAEQERLQAEREEQARAEGRREERRRQELRDLRREQRELRRELRDQRSRGGGAASAQGGSAAAAPSGGSGGGGGLPGRDCDANISVANGANCDFAQNVFYEYFISGRSSSISAWSPSLDTFLPLDCGAEGDGRVLCIASRGGQVRFTQVALDAYTDDAAARYAASNEVGPGD